MIILVLANPTPGSLCGGLFPVVLGESIRIWSSGHIHKNQVLTVTGPYSLTRNPLYVGSFLLGLGFVVATSVAWLIIAYLVFFGVIYWFTIRWEEDKLRSLFGSEWKEYSRNVPRFLPLLKIPRYRKGEFRWSQVFKNRELNNASVVAIVYLILWGKAILTGPR